MAGLSGWALQGGAATEAVYGLFFAQLPWVVTATLIPLVALRGRSPAPISLVIGLAMGGLLYPMATNWVWGGGWLANLGINLNLGHGFVDFAAAGTAHLVGGAVALAGLLVFVPRRPRRDAAEDEVVAPPAVHLPLLASVGALLVLAGSLGWAWANPLLDTATLMPMRGVVNAVLAAGGGALLPLAYIWFATGRPDALMAARGLAAGAVAGVAVGPFVPPIWALGMGALVGLAVPFLVYLVSELLRLEDDTGIVPVHLAGALLGLLAVGLLADGLAGAGWNQVGPLSYLGVPGQGVTGLLAAEGMQPDWPAQLQAQGVGLAALFLVPFLLTTVVLAPVAAVARGLAGRTGASQAIPEAAKGETSPAALAQESVEGA
jgi:Amt family ammonium transporter